MQDVTDDAGALVFRQRYLPFGGMRDNAGNGPRITETDFGYTGQRSPNDMGLMDYRARFYDPTIGRFIQPDSIIPSYANPQALNRFSYVLNSPVRYNDPSGHCVLIDSHQDGLCVHQNAATGENEVVHPRRHTGAGSSIIRDAALDMASRIFGAWNGLVRFGGRLGVQLPLELGAGYGELPLAITESIPPGLLKGIGRAFDVAGALLQMAPAQIENFADGDMTWGEVRHEAAADAVIDAAIIAGSAATGTAVFGLLTGATVGMGAVPAAVVAAAAAAYMGQRMNEVSYRSGVRSQLTNTLSNWSTGLALTPNPAQPSVPAPFAPGAIPVIGTPSP